MVSTARGVPIRARRDWKARWGQIFHRFNSLTDGRGRANLRGGAGRWARTHPGAVFHHSGVLKPITRGDAARRLRSTALEAGGLDSERLYLMPERGLCQ